MALEPALGHELAMQLKRQGLKMTLAQALEFASGSAGRARALAYLKASEYDRYGADPDRPGGVIRISPDGTRTRGWMFRRVFVPDKKP